MHMSDAPLEACPNPLSVSLVILPILMRWGNSHLAQHAQQGICSWPVRGRQDVVQSHCLAALQQAAVSHAVRLPATFGLPRVLAGLPATLQFAYTHTRRFEHRFQSPVKMKAGGSWVPASAQAKKVRGGAQASMGYCGATQ